jgi:alkaline phosphatase D
MSHDAVAAHRRHLLQRLGTGAAALAFAALFSPRLSSDTRPATAVRFDSYPFKLGIASGQPRPDSVVIWTRLAPEPTQPSGGLPPAPVAVRWEVAEDAAFAKPVQHGEIDALPEHAHSVHVDVAGLAPGREYFYRFTCGEAISPIGRTRTAPAADAAVPRLRVALASCQHYEYGHYAVHREIAARELDCVVFVGDYIYENNLSPLLAVRRHEGPPPRTLDDYRRRHAHYKLDADLRAAHAAHPWILTWDDHEVLNDYAADHASDHDRPAFLQRRVAAYKAYFEHLPFSPLQLPQRHNMRVHDRYSFGRLADLWALDGRQFRSNQACNDDTHAGGRILTPQRCAELGDSGRTMFGLEQERWLTQGLTSTPRQWKLLAQGTQISPSGLDTPLGRTVYSDGWDGYPQARERLLRTVADARLGNVVCLGGDVHRHVAATLRLLPNDGHSPAVASEFVTSSITSKGLSDAANLAMRWSNPDLLHARSDERGYALFDITPGRLECEFRAAAFPVEVAARLHTQARFVVESGQPGPLPA